MLIVGCGYLGRHVLADLDPETGAREAWVRSAASAVVLEGLADAVEIVDLDRPLVRDPLCSHRHVFYFAPPPSEGGEDTRMRHFLAWLAACRTPPRVLYVSTTGVYGDCDGEWVDETRPVNPTADRARRRWDAEEQLRAWRRASGGELVILRVAGIYGPGRLPIERLRRGTPMVAATQAPWTNRIHVHDLARACVLAMDRGRDGEIYNASDGNPGNMADYFNRVADITGLPRPPVVDLDAASGTLSPGLMSYLAESRRLDNRKLLEDTGLRLRYPTLDEGLPASIGAGNGAVDSSS